MLTNNANTSRPYRVNEDDVSATVQRLAVDSETRHQSVHGRGGVIAILYDTRNNPLERPFPGDGSSALATQNPFAAGRDNPTSTAKPSTYTGACACHLQHVRSAFRIRFVQVGAHVWYKAQDALWSLEINTRNTTASDTYIARFLGDPESVKIALVLTRYITAQDRPCSGVMVPTSTP